MAVTALAPAAAGARPVPADYSSCGKDYTKNAATGDYCATPTSTSSSSFTPAAPVASGGSDDGFAWGDAAVGAGGAIALFALAGGAATVTRRRFPATG
jgi:hypothetical protein